MYFCTFVETHGRACNTDVRVHGTIDFLRIYENNISIHIISDLRIIISRDDFIHSLRISGSRQTVFA